ncbi:MAG: hypothetical protein WKF89_08320 [Chitinophagaceae bacterium]
MKSAKLVMASIALCMSLVAFSQADTTRKDTTTTTRKDTATQKKDTASANLQQGNTSASIHDVPATNSQQSAASMSKSTTQTGSNNSSIPKPNFGRYYIPVIGTFQSSESATEAKSVSITGDESNPGRSNGNKVLRIA